MRQPPQSVVLRNVRQHNLKGITVEFPRRALSVITGPSGSGKSSLAFDTLYAEGQRRYIESLSTYAKQFLERMPKPLVDSMEGLSPAVAIEQKNPTTSSRSTVGTATEINDFLRLLWARAGTQTCLQCGRDVKRDTVQEAVDSVLTGNGTEETGNVVVAFPCPPRRIVPRLPSPHSCGQPASYVRRSMAKWCDSMKREPKTAYARARMFWFSLIELHRLSRIEAG